MNAAVRTPKDPFEGEIEESRSARPPNASEQPASDATMTIALIEPNLGQFTIDDLDDRLRLRSPDGVSDTARKDEVTVIRRQGPVLHVEWRGEPMLMDFGTEASALAAIGRLRPGEPPSVADSNGHVPGDIDEEVIDPREAQRRARAEWLLRVLRRLVIAMAATLALVLAAVGGIAIGRELIGSPTEVADPGPRPVVIKEAAGTGDQVVGRFAAEGPWLASWEHRGQGTFLVIISDPDGDDEVLVDHTGPGDGVAQSEVTGAIEVRVEADGEWQVEILERDPLAGQ